LNQKLTESSHAAFCVAIGCCLIGSIARASAATVVLPVNHDASIFQNNPDNASGAGNALLAGTNGSSSPRRAMIQFDLSAIPAGATIQSAELTLFLAQFAGSGGSGSGRTTVTIGLHRISSSWGEGATQRRDPPDDSLNGIGQGAPALVDDVTWNDRYFAASPPQLWLKPGGDFVSTVSSSTTVDTTLDAPFTWPSTPTVVADLQNWLMTPSTNFGWMLVNEDEISSRTFRAFYSREVATEAHRPALTITYSLPANPSAEFDGNHLVDGADFLIWQRGQGIAAGATAATGDANGDGAVNAADLVIWKQQFGTTLPIAAGVPEPAALIVAGAAAMPLLRQRRGYQ
jgi:hypothetical protein